MTRSPLRAFHAFTLAEVMVAMMSSVIILGALLLGSTQLQRALYASERYAGQQTNQRRLIDYLGRDLRRAIALGTATSVNGSGATPLLGAFTAVENGTSLVVTLPGYYQSDATGNPMYDEALPPVVADDYVDYGTRTGHAPGVLVIYRKEYVGAERCECFVRIEGDSQMVIVREAEDLHLELSISPDGRVCAIRVTFKPRGYSFSPQVTTHDHLLMRNIRTD